VTAGRCFVVVNPTAGAGRAGRLWPRIEQRLRATLGGFGHAMTAAPGHATVLTRSALLDGHTHIVAIGGDGTFGEVASGFFDGRRPLAPTADLSLLPAGTGCDLPRGIGLGCDLDQACAVMAGEPGRPIDVGHVAFVDHQARPTERIFLNVASFGCGGAVSAAVARAGKRLGSKLTFLLAAGRVLIRYRDQPVEVAVDDGSPERLRVTNYAVCNARYFGGGMQVAPGAEIDDGLFDITIWSGYGLRDFLLRWRQLYDGRHILDRRTVQLRGQSVSAYSDEQVLLDVDGENPGRLPVRIELLPGALRLKTGAPAIGKP
jgi:YegS/Rv2252/BmrU family lipid kinase